MYNSSSLEIANLVKEKEDKLKLYPDDLDSTKNMVSKIRYRRLEEPRVIGSLYHLKKFLTDGRNLHVFFYDVNDKGPFNPDPKSCLEIMLNKKRADQTGFHIMEYGITGDFNEYSIIPNGHTLKLLRKEVKDNDIMSRIQTSYRKTLDEVYKILTEDAKS